MRRMARPVVRALLVLSLFVPEVSAQKVVTTATFEIGRDLPQVRVMVNGQGPFTFGIDTGCGAEAVVMPSFAQHLKLPVVGEDTLNDPSRISTQKVPAVTIRSLNVAGVEFRNLRAPGFAGPPVPNVDGILCFGLFRHYLFTLDYPRRQFVLARGRLPATDGKRVIPFRMPDEIPVIELNVGTKKIDAHIDSGGKGITLPEKFAQSLKFAYGPAVVGRARTVANAYRIKEAKLTSDIRFGEYTFSSPVVEINPLFPIATLGSFALRAFAITFDQRNKLVRFVATEKIIVLAYPDMLRTPSQPQPPPGSQNH
jgi:hypothetical protein